MDKVAYFKGKEIARETAIKPKIEDKFNVEELQEFWHKFSRLKYNNKEIEFYVRYE